MEDYEQNDSEDFNEDHLDDGEYDELYDKLPLLQSAFDGYNNPAITERILKEALWYNYFNVEDAIAEVKSNFKPKGMYHTLYRIPTIADSSIRSRFHVPVPKTTLIGGSSKLAALAKKRGAERQSGLDKMIQDRQGDKSLDILNKLERSSKAKPNVVIPKNPTQVKPEIVEQPEEVKPQVIKLVDIQVTHFSRQPSRKITSFFAQNKHNGPIHNKRVLESGILVANPLLKRQKTNNFANQVHSNFSKPSPDDVVLAAQSDALGEKVLKMTIQEAKEPRETTPKATKPKKKIDFAKEYASKISKPSLSFVVIGHVDSGKSTTIGRFLYDLNVVDSKTVVKLQRESEKIGKSSFALAWIMDQTADERERGVTADICQTSITTEVSDFTIIDSPGHQDFIPQMINGVTQADVAVLIVDSSINSFEKGYVEGKTKEQLLIAKSLGIERLIVAVNKMDTNNWLQKRYCEIVDELTEFLVRGLSFSASNLEFVPVSGLLGDNVVKRSSNNALTQWYTGGTLLENLDSLNLQLHHVKVKSQSDIQSQPFVMTLNNFQSVKADECVIKGRINSGSCQPGETVCFLPGNETGIIDALYMDRDEGLTTPVQLGIVNEFVNVKFKKVSNVENLRIGDLISKVDKPLSMSNLFSLELKLFELDKPLLMGSPLVMFRNNVSIPVRIAKIHKVQSVVVREGVKKKVTKKNAKHLASNQFGLVDIQVDTRIPIVTFKESTKIGRVVLRKEGAIVGAGKVEQVF